MPSRVAFDYGCLTAHISKEMQMRGDEKGGEWQRAQARGLVRGGGEGGRKGRESRLEAD